MIKVYASASIGNVSVGFDVLGVGILPIDGTFLGDIVSVEPAKFFDLCITGTFFHELPKETENNIIYQSWKCFCDFLGKDYPVTIYLEKNIPIGSGLGSSACSIVATLVAMNNYCGNLLTQEQLLVLMAEMEGKVSGDMHFDNVAPCFLGGMQIILKEYGIISQKIPIFSNWLWIVAYPGTKISTLEARSILPKQYNRDDCVNYGRYLSGFIHACYTNQELLAANLMRDVISEPYRAKLLPTFFLVREEIMNIGALTCGISGSGPTVFGVSNNKKIAVRIADWLLENYLKNSGGFVHICRINFSGARILLE